MKIWATQLLQLALLIFLTATVNRTTGYFLYSLLFICLVFIIHQSILLAQLENWLKQGAKANQKPQKNAWKILYSRILNLTKTDKKRKKRLNNIISKYSKATATLPDAIVILGQQQTIQWFNNSAKLTLGLKKEHKDQSIVNFLNHPDATTFFQDPNAKNSLLTLASPSNKDLILEIKVLNYEIDSQLLVAHDVTYLKNIERIYREVEKLFPEAEINQFKVAIVSAIGSNMKVPGILAKTVTALADQAISVLAIHQAMRQVDMQFVINEDDYDLAIKSLHKCLVEDHAENRMNE